MRTTLDLDESLLEELLETSEAKTKTEAIQMAMRDFIRKKKLERLLALEGKVQLAPDWREREEEELKAQKERERIQRGSR